MIRLEHVNLVVSDMDAMLKFYRAAMPHWQVRGGGESSWYGKPRRWLHFGDDYSYIALSDNGEGGNRDLTGHQQGLAHFAFVTTDLNALRQRMQEAGYQVDKEGQSTEFRDNVYYIDPAGFEVEFVCYTSDNPQERNNYD
ncbi:VOC family protein [Shewanella sp. GXUN23E]|uniref:VOC family protein n=1 Tax=Shewanella sp. GXUN23E TaxID=3422498 RepID=UPI003D7D41A8